MVNPIEKALRFGERREEKRAQKLVEAIELLEPIYEDMSDDELRAQTDEFKDRIANSEELDTILPEAFAVVREASHRVLGKRQYPVQLLGGIALHFGQVAEMGTGEGKAVTIDTLIPTPEGARLAGDIHIGDTIYAGNGDLTAVTGVFPQGEQEVYRVYFEDGRSIDCNLEHLWDVCDQHGAYETVATSQVIERLEAGNLVFIPAQGATTSKKPIREHVARLLDDNNASTSLYLGCSEKPLEEDSEGSWALLRSLIDCGAVFTTIDLEEVSAVHYQLNLEKYEALDGVYNLGKILDDTVHPVMPFGSQYLPGSEQQIEQLIKHVSTLRVYDKVTAHAYSEAAAEAIAWVARSMGWYACIAPSQGFLPWVIDINKKSKKKIQIVAVERMGRTAEQVCFTVSHPSHLFLAGDHVVTHNTLTAVAPLYLNALTGKGAHLVTTNDYLAREQEEQMGRIYSFLGMTHGAIQEQMSPKERQDIYSRDIVYGTNNQFGFDYLRDNIAKTPDELVQRDLNYVIIDELDSILIDEAGTPLIISAPAGDASTAEKWFMASAEIVGNLKPDIHYVFDLKKRTAEFLDAGYDEIENQLGGKENAIFSTHSELLTFLNAALKAETLYTLDKDYIVVGGEVMIVDEHTGRAMEGRRYSHGLHQALEAKERRNGKLEVQIQPENPTVATITLQNFFRLYDTMSGMTGTAASEAAELADTYNLTVRTIPPNKEKQRVDLEDEIYISEAKKFKAVVQEIKALHDDSEGEYTTPEGEKRPLVQPILIGTTSVAASERLSRMLTAAGIKHNVLNAKHVEQEAHIVAQAGRLGAVTISTNMAGRGTDILLGGSADMLVEEQMKIMGLTPEHTPTAYEEQRHALQPIMDRKVAEEADLVRELGGLYVMGTARHDSRRIDNQLIGRSGRQGDPGRSKFFLSLEDELLRFYSPRQVAGISRVMAKTPDAPLSGKILSKAIENAQASIDGKHREGRKSTLEYDDVLTKQREKTYSERKRVLHGDADFVLDQAVWFIESAVSEVVEQWIADNGQHLDDWDLKDLWKYLYDELDWKPSISVKDVLEEYPTATELTSGVLVREIVSAAVQQWDIRVEAGREVTASFARQTALTAIDEEWIAHLAELDYLKEGIGMRAYAQKDPKVEYRLEAGDMYNQMNTVFVKRTFAKIALGPRR